MRSLWVILAGFGLLLAACSGIPGAGDTPQPLPSEAPTQAAPLPTATEPPIIAAPPHLPVDIPPIQRAAISSLAQRLGVPESQISLVSSESVTWPNGCMGVQKLGMMCTQNMVPGFRIVLSANGKQYELHTNLDGTVIVPADMAMVTPGSAQQAAIKQLATNLGISESDVKLVSSSAVEWPDGCLGVSMPYVMCAQVVTPGYLIVLEAGGRQYEYHTNQDASMIVPATLAMHWSAQGGIAGICEDVTIYLSGEVYGMNCGPAGDSHMAVLTAAQRTQLYAWIDQFTKTSIDLSDPKGASDAMTRKVDLMGKGQQAPNDGEKHALFDFGQKLYQQMYK